MTTQQHGGDIPQYKVSVQLKHFILTKITANFPTAISVFYIPSYQITLGKESDMKSFIYCSATTSK